MPQPLLKRIDHLVYATPDFAASVADFEASLGVRPIMGGQHSGRGTPNALLAVSDRPDLEMSQTPSRPFSSPGLTVPIPPLRSRPGPC